MGLPVDLPESCLRIAADATTGAVGVASLLSKRSWRTTFLTTLLLHALLRRCHALGGRGALLLLHTVVTSILLRELVLLVGIVLKRHFEVTISGTRECIVKESCVCESMGDVVEA